MRPAGLLPLRARLEKDIRGGVRGELHRELRRLAKRVSKLHQGCAALPRAQKHGVAVLLSVRDWEPKGFALLRRQPVTPASSFTTRNQ